MSSTDLPAVPDGFSWRVSESTAWIEASPGFATAAFSTRLGGVSEPPFAGLNLGLLTGDFRERVLENRARVAAAIGIDPASIAIGRQVHGAELASHTSPTDPPIFATGGQPPEVDGHLISGPGVAGLVFVADCLPIVISGSRGIAVLHAGWRGLDAGIVERAAGIIRASEMVIGPAIGQCCYEVGPEVAERFSGLGAGVLSGAMLDLPKVAAALGRRAGITSIRAVGLCTRCNAELFFSHRGEGPQTGRQAGIGWIGEQVHD